MDASRPRFRVARNPDGASRLPYLIRLPIDGGLALKARDTWPRASRVYCIEEATPWTLADADVLEEAETGRDAVVVEGDYPDLFRLQPGHGSWLADLLGRLAVRYPEVPIVFPGSRKFAEEWAYRFLGAAAEDRTDIA